MVINEEAIWKPHPLQYVWHPQIYKTKQNMNQITKSISNSIQGI